jgi:hypothetical protein
MYQHKNRPHYVTRHNEFLTDFVCIPNEDGNSAPVHLWIYFGKVSVQNCQHDGIFVFVRPFVRSILSGAGMDRDSRPYVFAVK